MSNFLAPLTRYSLDRAAQMLCTHGADCTSEDLLTLWKENHIELCFSLPDYIAFENVPAPGTGREVLLSVSPASFHVFWESVEYDLPPSDYAMLCVKEYASADSYRERKLYVYLDPHYSIYDDNGQRLCAVLSLTYGLDGLCIPGKELEKVFRFLTQPDGGDPYGETTVNNYAERHAANREQLYKVAIGVLADYPNECRGLRKEISPEKWAKAILEHAKDYPPLVILSEDTITDHLRAAVNIKTRAKRQKGE